MSDTLEEIAQALADEYVDHLLMDEGRAAIHGLLLKCQIDADHEWAKWCEKWKAAIDLVGERREDRAEIGRLRAEVAQLRYREAGGESSARHALGEAVEQRQAAEAELAAALERERARVRALNPAVAEVLDSEDAAAKASEVKP